MFLIQDFFSILEIKQLLGMYIVRYFGKFFQVGLDHTGFHGVFIHMLKFVLFILEYFLDLVRWVFFIKFLYDLL